VAEDVVDHTVAAPRAEPEPLVEPRRPREHPRIYRWRFGIAYLALAAAAGVGVGLAIMIFQRPAEAEEPAWSSWQPTGRETSYADQIAEYVASRYRLESGEQVAPVLAGPPIVESLPVQAVAIENRSAVPNARPQIEIFETGNSVMYTFCGLGGPNCAIQQGQQSDEQMRLLRREALELSLYTFKYVEEADSTIVLLPPNVGDPEDPQDDTAAALFLRKQDFGRELGQPLRQTLAEERPPAVAEFDPREALIVDRLTEQNLFLYGFQQVPTGGAMIVLSPLTARR
jgi:hypothetical protein